MLMIGDGVLGLTHPQDAARRKIEYEIMTSEQEGGFVFDSAELTDSAKQQIEELVRRLKQQPTAAHGVWRSTCVSMTGCAA
jgi:outer membrane protein OmpA-like peptidoglycan-associated protein